MKQSKKKAATAFPTTRRIRLGIWGLGRGMSFYRMCRHLNADVVAGCDYNEHMRRNFLAQNPGAFATADADEFLRQDFDAVLLATFCPAHADDAIRCLRAGKHVLSEVTAFHTMAEGVRLVEEVERSGKVYNLAENYPFTAANDYLARKWKEGLFGDLLYAEYEYVHECRVLQYTYIDGLPVQPGHQVHSWRSWLNGHYYCTHSLGPIMIITGLRPTRVVALPSTPAIAGIINRHIDPLSGAIGISPSLIRMSNGAVIRNLMGGTTNDTHVQRIWGTLGSAENNVGKNLQLRLGASGLSPKYEVTPRWEGLGELAARTGHGGGDFWIMYYFVRQILTGEKAPFDIYGACDVTIPGILALRSAVENGQPYDVPDFRDATQRAAWQDDTWAQPRFDTRTGAFGSTADPSITEQFSRTIADLVRLAPNARAYADWKRVAADLVRPGQMAEVILGVIGNHAAMVEIYRRARQIVDAYPESEGGRVLCEMLGVGLEKEVLARGYLAQARRALVALRRRYPAEFLDLTEARMSDLRPPVKTIAAAPKPPRGLKYQPAGFLPTVKLLDVRAAHENHKDGLVYLRGQIIIPKSRAGKGHLLYGADGPVKAWVNGQPAGCHPEATNPAVTDQFAAPAIWRAGANEVVFALATNKGAAWGVMARAVPGSG